MSSVTMYEMNQMEEQKKNATIWNRAYKQGQKDVLGRMLEIIEKERDLVTRTANIDEEYVSALTVLIEIRKAVLALKGEQE